jgi:MFS family permease
MVAAAAPLLVASISDDPVLIGLAVFVQQLPWLLFSLFSGAVIDRIDKRRLIVAVDVLRGLLVAAFALSVWSGHVSIPLIYGMAFVLGTGETLAANAAATLVPAVVDPDRLPTANARLHGSYFVLNRFAGQPIGATLFVLAAAVPFGLDAVSFLFSALLVATMSGIRGADAVSTGGTDAGTDPGTDPDAPARSIRAEIGEGLRWVWHDPVVRMMSAALCVMNIALSAGFSIMVLYARDQLGLGDVGYGFLLSASAVGGALGVLVTPRLQSWFRASVLLRAGLVIETLTHVGLALSTTAWAAASVLVVFGVHSSVLGGVETTQRQRRVPEELRGRVQSVFMMLGVGGHVFGALLGGPLVRWQGVSAPFWCSAVAMTLVTLVSWRPFGRNLPTGTAGTPETAAGEAYSLP